MGGFIIGVVGAIIIYFIIYLANRLKNKRKADKNDDIVELSTSDKNIDEKEK